MMSEDPSRQREDRSRGPGLLLELDARRVAAALRRPSIGLVLLLVLAVALIALVALVGPEAFQGVPAAPRLVTAALLLAGVQAFAAYGVLFRPPDNRFLRRLGIPASALVRERSLRLLLGGIALGVLIWLPASTGMPRAEMLVALLAAAVVSWAASLATMAWATHAMAFGGTAESPGCLGAGMWDREVAAAAPLVYAPVPPLLAGPLAVVFLLAAPLPYWASAAVLLCGGAMLSLWAERRVAAALGRFLPQVFEMSFAETPDTGAERLVFGRGVARLVPRRIAAVWARDAAVGGRRFAWASRLVWPVAIAAFFSLARWGSLPETRTWVVASACAVLLLQALALAFLGALERRGARWIDRALGIRGGVRFSGRWLWGIGMSLWLTVPVALAWHWWVGGGAWMWLAAGAGTSFVGAASSTLALAR